MQKVNFKRLEASQRRDFIAGWEAAGGIVEDTNGNRPAWSEPWRNGEDATNFHGENPREWGAEYWKATESAVVAEKTTFLDDLLYADEADEDMIIMVREAEKARAFLARYMPDKR